eukprot:TRINITY_DN24261_c0_g1_i1.p1 TRINITY_DN24261_c0_g1~~TRINITY_DN24261_c0_g1_i1.p1  ORF type:complete len:322 (+),score=39.01 TRINITY_DN24261_c0_g1_i1:63-968(+)
MEQVIDYAACCAVGMFSIGIAASKSEHVKGLIALMLFAGLIVGGLRNHYETTISLINPLDLCWQHFAAGYLLKLFSLKMMDKTIRDITEYIQPPPLKYRLQGSNKSHTDRPFKAIDLLYLGLNSVLETIFLFHFANFIITNDVKWRVTDFTVLNTIPSMWILLFVNDMLYAPLHLLMHVPVLYPYVHKHHHRSLLPSRYYLDAGNDHPWEQVGGLLCLWASMHFSLYTCGLHVVVIALMFSLYLVIQILNHCPFDCRFNILGITYESGLHEMHHRNPSCNMAQYCMLFDSLIGTYRPYVSE